MKKNLCDRIDFATTKRNKSRVEGASSCFRELVTRCISDCSGIFGALAALVTAIQVGWNEGVLHVSYCSMEP